MVSIRRRILEKGNIIKEQFVRTLQDHEDRITALEQGNSSNTSTDEPNEEDDGSDDAPQFEEGLYYQTFVYKDKEGTQDLAATIMRYLGEKSGNYIKFVPPVDISSYPNVQGGAFPEKCVPFYVIASAKIGNGVIYTAYSDAGSTKANFYVQFNGIQQGVNLPDC